VILFYLFFFYEKIAQMFKKKNIFHNNNSRLTMKMKEKVDTIQPIYGNFIIFHIPFYKKKEK